MRDNLYACCGAEIEAATLTIADKIVSYCNLMLACFDKPNVLLAFITMLLPLTVLIGVGVKKLTKHNKTA